ncbi:MAG TPA: hypothetical protein VE338_21010 [Ktedonobacterales bacterium]|jgi:hypothetical protein|nr:hypothetical protein [Ktedonobacterales bacterium]
MTRDATSSTSASAPASPRRSRRQVGCLSSLALLILLALTVCGIEYNAWHGGVDGYTYVARGDHDQVIAHVVSHDAKAASALRQKINAKPILLPPQGPNMGCTLPLNTPPLTVADYRYTFYSSGQVIETVASENPTCGVADVTCGGVTIWLGDMRPPMPTGMRETQP